GLDDRRLGGGGGGESRQLLARATLRELVEVVERGPLAVRRRVLDPARVDGVEEIEPRLKTRRERDGPLEGGARRSREVGGDDDPFELHAGPPVTPRASAIVRAPRPGARSRGASRRRRASGRK